MPFKRFDQARPFATLTVLVIVWVLVPTAVKTFSRASFFELTAPVTVAASKLRDLREYWALRMHTNHELILAGQDAANTASSFEFAVSQNQELHAEIARLEGLLRLPSFNDYRYEHARVTRRDFSGWWQRIVIRKGANFGIPVDAPVIFTGGVVGRVAEVHATTAIVELISSPGLRLAGVIEGDTRPISFQGGVNATFAPPTGLAESVPLDVIATPALAKRLVTSGFGGVFPPGLVLGTLTSATIGSDGLFKTGEVLLDERLGSLTEVTVLVPLVTP
ncbi:MAG: rod shape-determining protein MreC [Opitutaceae bacterium]